MSLVVVDATVVNVINPSIIDDSGIGSSTAQWVQESYAMVLSTALIPAIRPAAENESNNESARDELSNERTAR
jgi:hypothetical protein